MTQNDEFDVIVSRLEANYEQGLELYSKLADEIINDRITDPRKIELVWDDLSDFSYADRFEILYKKICRHIFHRHTQLVEEHVAMFRESISKEESDSNMTIIKNDAAARKVLDCSRPAFDELAK